MQAAGATNEKAVTGAEGARRTDSPQAGSLCLRTVRGKYLSDVAIDRNKAISHVDNSLGALYKLRLRTAVANSVDVSAA